MFKKFTKNAPSKTRHALLKNTSEESGHKNGEPYFDDHKLAVSHTPFEAPRQQKLNGFENTNDEQSGGLADVATSALGSELLLCSHAIERNQGELGVKIKQVRSAISERLSGEARLAAQGLRLTIGIIWLSIAAALIFANGKGILTKIPDAHASSLAILFLIAAVPACLFAMVAGVYINQSAGTNRRVRQTAENLGLHIAHVAREFDEKLTSLLGDVNKDQYAGKAVENISRAHMAALEAQIFFRRLKFLHAEPREEALRELARFLRGGGPGGSAPAPIIFFGGLVFGAIVSFMLFGAKPTGPATGSPANVPDIMRYPGLFFTLIIGGLTYVFAGLVSDFLIPFFGGLRRKALDDTLESLRSAYTADNAPRFVDVIRRVEETMSAFQARLDSLRRGQKTNATSHSGVTGSVAQQEYAHRKATEDETSDLAWRKGGRNRDGKARFVETGFQASPEPFALDKGRYGDQRGVSSGIKKK